MTYKLNPAIAKIASSVTLIFPNGTRHSYSSGAAVADQVFNEKYRIAEIRAVEGLIEIKLEAVIAPVINAIGEETFF